MLKLRDDNVKGDPRLLNCSHYSGFLSPLLLQGCRHPAPTPAPIRPSQADFEERDRIDHSRIDRRWNSSSERRGFCLDGWLVGWVFLYCFCVCGLYVPGCCLPPPKWVFTLPCHSPFLISCYSACATEQPVHQLMLPMQNTLLQGDLWRWRGHIHMYT